MWDGEEMEGGCPLKQGAAPGGLVAELIAPLKAGAVMIPPARQARESASRG